MDSGAELLVRLALECDGLPDVAGHEADGLQVLIHFTRHDVIFMRGELHVELDGVADGLPLGFIAEGVTFNDLMAAREAQGPGGPDDEFVLDIIGMGDGVGSAPRGNGRAAQDMMNSRGIKLADDKTGLSLHRFP